MFLDHEQNIYHLGGQRTGAAHPQPAYPQPAKYIPCQIQFSVPPTLALICSASCCVVLGQVSCPGLVVCHY